MPTALELTSLDLMIPPSSEDDHTVGHSAMIRDSKATTSMLPIGWMNPMRGFVHALVSGQINILHFAYTLFLFTKSDIRPILLPLVNDILIGLSYQRHSD